MGNAVRPGTYELCNMFQSSVGRDRKIQLTTKNKIANYEEPRLHVF